MPGRIRRASGLLAGGALLSVAAAEWMHWRASRRYLGSGQPAADGRSEAVIVLGCPPKRNGQPNLLQRWRCQIAVRSMDPARDGRLIFSGAARPGGPSEAAVMSGYAQDVLGVPSGRISLETKARSTWQNVEFTLPIAETADVIKFASDPMHAARARQFVLLQRPELAGRLGAGADYRLGEHSALKVFTAGYQVARTLWRSKRLRALIGAGCSLASGSIGAGCSLASGSIRRT
jgi:hypothetical protein